MKTAILRALNVIEWYILFTIYEFIFSHKWPYIYSFFYVLLLYYDEVSHCALVAINVKQNKAE